MDIEVTLTEKLHRFEDLKNQLLDLNKQIGALSEQQRAIYNQGLELKGQIDMLMELKIKRDEVLAQSKTAGLTLPVGVKPVVEENPAIAPEAM